MRRTERLTADPAGLARAAELLRKGGLVAFPTETVYGLGALALDGLAVRGIFAAKGRPATNPVIVHVTGATEAAGLVEGWPPAAQALADRHWPGPLTLVLPRRPVVPDEVTAGGGTVGVRAPAHPVAQALLRAVGAPIAAPSANRSEHVSPTLAEHVLADLDGRIDAVLDGGGCEVGIESTVLSLAHGPVPRLLRPGGLSRAALEAELGPIAVGAAPAAQAARPPAPDHTPVAASPGQHHRHYAPAGQVILVSTAALPARLAALPGPRGALVRGAAPAGADAVERLPDDPAGYARGLYAALRALEARGCAAIAVEDVPPGGAWEALRDRLVRACAAG
ncbi:MAG: L-threonylcarbamoyladenylate synthase [Anaeromyxobacter sp.]